ncbi:MAG: hypothetical protein KA099_05225 [Alphaproteobacteria bacterium]|nr:hypothetical protein [Alphaproteobacteria bacterium]MBP7757696.1 hypothetical protein [Alphaproteobacteria bacterium]MBP7761104.1 hypothetical protein [Alphaproteobacteria bacterium]MBP7904714.1 hypothetical protein [Alphaproteobacteria bacterium]
MSAKDNFNHSSSFNWQDFWFHALIMIPIEFGILHSTPLGPMLSSFFGSVWSGLGMDFAAHAGTEVLAQTAAESAALGSCHFHGAEMVCH